MRELAIELTMLVMIENQKDEILVQDRRKKDWPGWTFPGGHVEPEESILAATIREIQEETGLLIQPTLKGYAEWHHPSKKTRELAFLFTAKTTAEPENTDLFWVTKEELLAQPLAGTLKDLLPIFFGAAESIYFEN